MSRQARRLTRKPPGHVGTTALRPRFRTPRPARPTGWRRRRREHRVSTRPPGSPRPARARRQRPTRSPGSGPVRFPGVRPRRTARAVRRSSRASPPSSSCSCSRLPSATASRSSRPSWWARRGRLDRPSVPPHPPRRRPHRAARARVPPRPRRPPGPPRRRVRPPCRRPSPHGPPRRRRPRIHVVARGETLTSIAARYGVSVGALAAANGITDPNTIYAGQRLVIPGP